MKTDNKSKVIRGWKGLLKDKNNLILVEFADTVRFPDLKISLLSDCNLDKECILKTYKSIVERKWRL